MEWFADENMAAAITADLRKFYSVSPYSAGSDKLSYRELWDLILQAAKKSESAFGALLRKWESPATDEELLLMTLIDVEVMKGYSGKGAKPKPLPRPWDKAKKKDSSQTFGSVAHLSEDEKKKATVSALSILEKLRPGGEGIKNAKVEKVKNV